MKYVFIKVILCFPNFMTHFNSTVKMSVFEESFKALGKQNLLIFNINVSALSNCDLWRDTILCWISMHFFKLLNENKLCYYLVANRNYWVQADF